MTRTIRTCTAALTALALSACALELNEPRPVSLEFSAEEVRSGEWLERPEVTASADAGEIRVEARLSAPDPCQRLTGEATRSGSQVTLGVRIERVGEVCIAMIGTFEYTAAIGELAPGTYHLRVVHEYPGTGWPSGAVLEQTVEVR